MASDNCKITIHMVSSLDGVIAKKDNDISWFETSGNYEKGVVGEDPEEFLKTIDCYVMGSLTYELALELSKSYGWAFVNEQLKPKYKNVWIAGGATLVKDFIRLKLTE